MLHASTEVLTPEGIATLRHIYSGLFIDTPRGFCVVNRVNSRMISFHWIMTTEVGVVEFDCQQRFLVNNRSRKGNTLKVGDYVDTKDGKRAYITKMEKIVKHEIMLRINSSSVKNRYCLRNGIVVI